MIGMLMSENLVAQFSMLFRSIQKSKTNTQGFFDFKNEKTHFIIFKNKVFKIDKRSKEQYNQAKNYGISLGIPKYQVDFHPEVEEWKK